MLTQHGSIPVAKNYKVHLVPTENTDLIGNRKNSHYTNNMSQLCPEAVVIFMYSSKQG
jgi:hypothetical protein